MKKISSEINILKIIFFIIILIIIVVLLPIVVNVLFSTAAPINIFEAQFTAGDLLSFFASALTLIGTLTLSFVTIYLNKKQELLNEKRYEDSIKSLLCILYGGRSLGKTTDLDLHFSNFSSIIAINIFLLKYELYDCNDNLIKTVDFNNQLIISFVEPMKTRDYKLNNIEGFVSGTKIIVYYKYYNTFNNEYNSSYILSLGKNGQILPN